MAHTVYVRFTVLSNFSKLQFFSARLDYFEISTLVMRNMLTMANIV